MKLIKSNKIMGILLTLFVSGVIFADEEAQIATSYGKHGLTFKTGDSKFSLSLGSRLQFRYTFEDFDKESGQDDQSSFQVKRAKVFLQGNAFSEDLTYKVQVNAAGSAVSLEDFYMNYKLAKVLRVRAGQYKVPFNRQELTSSGNQQFVDRAITNGVFALNRDQGVTIYSFALNDYLEYAAGIFNGNGKNKSANENNGHLYAGRIAIYPLGKFNMYSESDTDSTESLKAGIAFAGAYNRRVTFKDDEEDFTKDVTGITADGIVKWHGASVVGDYFWKREDIRNLTDVASQGLNIQAGMFIIPKNIEIAVRFAVVDPDQDTGNDKTQEIAGTANYFIQSHKLKIQTDYAQLTEEQGNKDNRIRMQFQIIF